VANSVLYYFYYWGRTLALFRRLIGESASKGPRAGR
jgi:hypothetical protein